MEVQARFFRAAEGRGYAAFEPSQMLSALLSGLDAESCGGLLTAIVAVQSGDVPSSGGGCPGVGVDVYPEGAFIFADTPTLFPFDTCQLDELRFAAEQWRRFLAQPHEPEVRFMLRICGAADVEAVTGQALPSPIRRLYLTDEPFRIRSHCSYEMPQSNDERDSKRSWLSFLELRPTSGILLRHYGQGFRDMLPFALTDSGDLIASSWIPDRNRHPVYLYRDWNPDEDHPPEHIATLAPDLQAFLDALGRSTPPFTPLI